MTEQFYVIDPEEGVDVYDTAQEAEDAAQAALEHYRDQCSDGWHEDIAGLEWGRMVTLGHACQCNVVHAEDDETGRLKENGWDYSCDYTLRSATDELSALRARVAELKFALGDEAGWFDRYVAEHRKVAELETMQKALHIGIASDAGIIREMRERLSILEAPPVVPVGYSVEQVDQQVDRAVYLPRWELWCHGYDDEGPVTVAHVYVDSHGSKNLATTREYDCEPVAALRALLWATEHDQRPPHASDGEKTP